MQNLFLSKVGVKVKLLTATFEALEHLISSSQRVQIKGVVIAECNACAISKMKHQVRSEPWKLLEGRYRLRFKMSGSHGTALRKKRQTERRIL
jgi:hypothetical protein